MERLLVYSVMIRNIAFCDLDLRSAHAESALRKAVMLLIKYYADMGVKEHRNDVVCIAQGRSVGGGYRRQPFCVRFDTIFRPSLILRTFSENQRARYLCHLEH